MPIFEYQCDSCGNRFEKLVRRSDDAMSAGCPSCGEKHLSQQFSTFAARANGVQREAAPARACGGGMCRTPDVCGRN